MLSRNELVEHSHEPSPVFEFDGSLPATDGGCGPKHGPYTVAAADHVRAIDVFANADTPLQDIVLNLYFGTTLVASADTLFTPESIRYGRPPAFRPATTSSRCASSRTTPRRSSRGRTAAR